MKSNVKKVNEMYVCETIFGNNNEFTYISKFKTDLKGVAYQELKTTAIPKDELDTFKNLGCKNIAAILKDKYEVEVDANQLLEHRKAMLNKARNQDVKGQTSEEKLAYHQDKIARLEAELEQAKKDFEVEKQEILDGMKQELARTEELKKKIKELSK